MAQCEEPGLELRGPLSDGQRGAFSRASCCVVQKELQTGPESKKLANSDENLFCQLWQCTGLTEKSVTDMEWMLWVGARGGICMHSTPSIKDPI